MSFTVATSVDEALAAMAAGARPIAGGSDLVVAARHGKAPLPDDLVAIDRLVELGGIERQADGGLRIGAMVTHARLMADTHVIESATALADASALVGSPSTRNVGTLGGNVMNASPAMDTGAPLVVLGALLELRSTTATRLVPVAEFWTGPGQTTAAAGELCTAIVLPPAPGRSASAYVRLEYRRAMEIAVVGAAAAVSLDGDGEVVSVRVALTAVAPTILEVNGLDVTGLGDLLGGSGGDALLAAVAERASQQAAPISDLRASDGYRRHCVGVMARRAVEAAARRAAGEAIAVPVNRSIGIGAS